MLHFSAIISWNASENNSELILIHGSEVAFPSYENQKVKIFEDVANIISYISIISYIYL